VLRSNYQLHLSCSGPAVALEQEIPHLEPTKKNCVNPCEPQVKNSNVESERSDGTGATGDTIGA
jgi:hypothetical protein